MESAFDAMMDAADEPPPLVRIRPRYAPLPLPLPEPEDEEELLPPTQAIDPMLLPTLSVEPFTDLTNSTPPRAPSRTPSLRETARANWLASSPVKPENFASWADYLTWHVGRVSISKVAGAVGTERIRANYTREIAEVQRRESRCETCGLSCTPVSKASFEWCHRKGSERRGDRSRMLSKIIENNTVERMEAEFVHVWLQCRSCHNAYKDWDGLSPPHISTKVAKAPAPLTGFSKFRRSAPSAAAAAGSSSSSAAKGPEFAQ